MRAQTQKKEQKTDRVVVIYENFVFFFSREREKKPYITNNSKQNEYAHFYADTEQIELIICCC